MNEHFPVSAQEQLYDYYQSPEYFRSLDTPLPMEEVEDLRRLHEPVRYSEDGKRRIPIEKQADSPLHKMIFSSSIRNDERELERLRRISAEYATRIIYLPEDEHGTTARQAILSELLAKLPLYGAQEIEGLQRYDYPGGPATLMLDGAPIDEISEVYKEIVPQTIRPSDQQWLRIAVDTPPRYEAPIEQYDLTTPYELVDVEYLADDEPILEDNDDVIGYETFHNAKLITLQIGARALAAVTGQIEKIEHLLTKTAA